MKEILTIEHLSKSFTIHNLHKHIEALNDVCLALKEGEFVGLLGKAAVGNLLFLNVSIAPMHRSKAVSGITLKNSV